MMLVIDALSARQGGGQTYLYNLLKNFPRTGDDILLLVPGSFRLDVNHPDVRRVTVGAWAENPFLRAFWQRFVLPRWLSRLRADVLFCPGGLIGTPAPTGCRTATMFRNMIPFDPVQRARYRFGYTRIRNWLLERLFLSSMRRANLVIFISDYARRVINERAPGDIQNAAVIPHGVADRFRDHGDPPLRPAWLPAGEYLLYVSSVDVYKAQCEVVRAFALLRAQRPATREHLIFAGPENDRDYARLVREEITRLGLDERVIMTGAVPYDELPGLYRHASAHVFASESENCPNILLEAMVSGRPVLSSNLPPMPEFGSDAVLYFDPRRPEDLAQRLMELLDNPQNMKELGRRGIEQAARYDWGVAARATRDALASLAGASVAQ